MGSSLSTHEILTDKSTYHKNIILLKMRYNVILYKCIINGFYLDNLEIVIDKTSIDFISTKKNCGIFPISIDFSDIFNVSFHDRIEGLFKIDNHYYHSESIELEIRMPLVYSSEILDIFYNYSSQELNRNFIKLIFATEPDPNKEFQETFGILHFIWQNHLSNCYTSEFYSITQTPETKDFSYYSNGILNNSEMNDAISYINELSCIIRDNHNLKRTFFASSILFLSLIRQLEGFPTNTNIEVYIDYILSIYKLIYSSLINLCQIAGEYNNLSFSEMKLKKIIEILTPKYIDSKNLYDKKKLIEIDIFQILILKEIEEILKLNGHEIGKIKSISSLIENNDHLIIRISQYLERVIYLFHCQRTYTNIDWFIIYTFFSLCSKIIRTGNHDLLVYLCRNRPDFFWTWMNSDYQYEKLYNRKDTNLILSYQMKLNIQKISKIFVKIRIFSSRNTLEIKKIKKFRHIMLIQKLPSSNLQTSIIKPSGEILINNKDKKTKTEFELDELLFKAREVIESLKESTDHLQISSIPEDLLLDPNDPKIILKYFKSTFITLKEAELIDL